MFWEGAALAAAKSSEGYNIREFGSALLPTVLKINKTKFHYRCKDAHLTYLLL